VARAPLVSVLIPAWNVEAFISDALANVQNQSYSNLEIIVVDDGSTDSTAAIVAKAVKKDKRISLYRQSNCGVAAVRDTLFSLAKGKYFHFFDADDWLDKNYYEECVKIAEQTGADLCVTGFETTKWQSQGQAGISYSEPYIVSDLEDKIKAIGGLQFRSMVWRYLFRADFVRRADLKFTEGRFMEDMRFTPVALAKSDKMAVVPHVLYHYVNNPLSITAKDNARKYHADHKDARKMVKALDKKYRLSGLLMRNFVKEATMRNYKLFGLLTWLRCRDYNTSRIWYLFGLIPVWRQSK